MENRRETWRLLMDAEKLLMGLPDGGCGGSGCLMLTGLVANTCSLAVKANIRSVPCCTCAKRTYVCIKSRKTWQGVASGDSRKTAYKANSRAETPRGYTYTITQKTVLKTALKRYLFRV